jgi:two-component system, chemotaxis family, chemotaxis protein CheY
MSHTPRALIVDDAVAIRHLLRLALTTVHDIQIDEASDGSEAMRLLATNTYDVVLLDLHMPVIDGWKVLSFLEGRGTPMPKVIVISTQGDAETQEKARAHGAFAVLAKPLSMHELRRVVRDALGLEDALHVEEDEEKTH